MTFGRTLSSALAILAATGFAAAEPIAAYNAASLGYYQGPNLILSQTNSNTGNSPVGISGCLIDSPTQSACAEAVAAPGRLGSRSSFRNLDAGAITPGDSASSNGYAEFVDILTITGLPAGNYTFTPGVLVEGHSSWDNVAIPQTAGIGVNQWGPDGVSMVYGIYPDATQPAFSATFTLDDIAFQPGVPFNFRLGFGTAARIYGGAPGTQNTFVEVDFLSTMLLVALDVRDNTGALIPFESLNVDSASGAVYSANGVVPEPSTWILVAASVTCLLLGRRRAA